MEPPFGPTFSLLVGTELCRDLTGFLLQGLELRIWTQACEGALPADRADPLAADCLCPSS